MRAGRTYLKVALLAIGFGIGAWVALATGIWNVVTPAYRAAMLLPLGVAVYCGVKLAVLDDDDANDEEDCTANNPR